LNDSIKISHLSVLPAVGRGSIRSAAAVLVALILLAWPICAAGADAENSEFLGKLSLAVQSDVSAKLQLTDKQQAQLNALLEDRESKALDLAAACKDLPAAERAQKLAAFRGESEAQCLALLTPVQQKLLEQVRLSRLGLASLSEEGVAGRLQLSDDQKKQIAGVLDKRKADLQKADEKTARTVKAESERALAAILTEKQRAEWDAMSANGAVAGEAAPAITEAKPALPDTSKNDQEAAKPAKTDEKTAAASGPGAASPRVELPKHPDKIRFKFRYQPWKEVLDWFAQQADLSLVMDAPPPGTFNYSDDKEFTPTEAIDLLNDVLRTKGYTLVRNERMLMLVNLEDGIPPNLVQTVPLDSLDKRGRSELVRVIFDLDRLSPEDAAAEVDKLKGPQTIIVPLTKSRQLSVTDTVAHLRDMRDVIKRVEDPQGLMSGQLRTYSPRYYTPEELLPILRQILEIPEDKSTTPDGGLRLAVDAPGKRLLATGKPEKLARLEEILKTIDVPKAGSGASDLEGSPQVEVYTINTADPQSTLKVMQTLLAGLPDVRMDIDPKTTNLIVLARPSQHATIRAVLDQMQRDARQVEVIRLRLVDPQLAVLSINKLFGATGDAAKSGSGAPQVDADPTTRQLLIRGTAGQIAQIREMLRKMGESDSKDTATASMSNMRTIPMSQRSVRSVIDRLEEIWPSVRPANKLRVVTPSSSIPTSRPSESSEGSPIPPQLLERLRRGPPPPRMNREEKGPSAEIPQENSPHAVEPSSIDSLPDVQFSPYDRTTRGPRAGQIHLVADEVKITAPEAGTVGTSATIPPAAKPTAPPAAAEKKEPPQIIVVPGPGGITITSEDQEALNDLERLITSLIGGTTGLRPEFTVFYLKHAKAPVVAATLDQIFGGGTLSTTGYDGGGGTLLGNLAGAALGDTGGGIIGTLLNSSTGGRVQATGSLKITPDTRLNALIVQANPNDLDTIEQLLKLLDQKDSPEDVLVSPRAKMIQLYNTDASQVAQVVQEVYRDRMVMSSQMQNMQNMGPQQFFQQMFGGGRGGRGGRQQQADEQPKMSIGVDTRSNSLIVAAPDSLFEEVKQLVEQLDSENLDVNDQVKVVTLHHSSTQAVESALSALGGENVQITRAAGATPSGAQFGQYGGRGFQGGQRAGQGRGGQQFGQRGGGGTGGFQGNFQRGGGGGGNFQAGGGNFQRGGGGGNFQGGNFNRGGGGGRGGNTGGGRGGFGRGGGVD
jgi:type II secretory pathway component GspD/PulD (secretin)